MFNIDDVLSYFCVEALQENYYLKYGLSLFTNIVRCKKIRKIKNNNLGIIFSR